MSSPAIAPRRVTLAVPWLALGVGFAALVLGALAVVAPSRAIVVAAGLIFVAVAFRSLVAGVAIFTFLIFFTQFASPSVSLVKVAGFVLVGSWLLKLASGSTEMPVLLRRHPALSYALTSFFVWALISSLWAVDGRAAISTALRLGQAIL